MEAIQDQLHARRNAQLVKYPKKVISHDLVLARGYSPIQVALFCYMIAIALAGISWKERGMSPVEAVVASALSFAALAVVEIRLGSLQFGHTLHRPVVSLRAVSNKRAPNQ